MQRQAIVVKMDGSEEPFDKEKLMNSIIKAGASPEVARKVANKVSRIIARRGKLTSREIRRIVLTELEKLDPLTKDGWVFYDRIVKGRITYEGGKFIVVEKGNLYLGREVKDIGPKGLSHVEEIEGILKELEEDLKHGIPRRTINARTRILYLAVLRSKLLSPEDKKKAVELINKFRESIGWRPFELKKEIS